ATVSAASDVVVGRVSGADFIAAAQEHARAWMLIAVELCERLRQRGRLIDPPNDRPVLFIGSSTEALPVARAIQSGLAHDGVEVRLWTNVFHAGHYAAEETRSSTGAL